jgi:hypothetical protein
VTREDGTPVGNANVVLMVDDSCRGKFRTDRQTLTDPAGVFVFLPFDVFTFSPEKLMCFAARVTSPAAAQSAADSITARAGKENRRVFHITI